MKKRVFFILIIGVINCVIGQDNTSDTLRSNELKLNVFNLLIESVDVQYEHIINESGSVGFGLLFNISDSELLRDYRVFSATTFYRGYFSNKYAKGFFFEFFAMINSSTDEFRLFNDEDDMINDDVITDFALGFGLGHKWVSKNGFMVDLYFGLGRNLLNTNVSNKAVGRGGLALGYRF